MIFLKVAKIYRKKKANEKGIAFPVCISPNDICGHYSPMANQEQPQELYEGDIVKVDLGVHIDGYIAQVAHTLYVTANSEKKVHDRKADVVLAAFHALDCLIKSLKAGAKNNDLTRNIETIVESYQCQSLEGVLSHEVKKHLIDGNNVIINKESVDQKVEECEIGVNQAWVLDVIVSTGEGKAKETDFRTTVFKRALERNYQLRSSHARNFIYTVIENHPSLCFSISGFNDEITAKVGVKESLQHGLLVPYPVLREKQGEIVAQFKATCLVLPSRTIQIAGLPHDTSKFVSNKKITDQKILDIL